MGNVILKHIIEILMPLILIGLMIWAIIAIVKISIHRNSEFNNDDRIIKLAEKEREAVAYPSISEVAYSMNGLDQN